MTVRRTTGRVATAEASDMSKPLHAVGGLGCVSQNNALLWGGESTR